MGKNDEALKMLKKLPMIVLCGIISCSFSVYYDFDHLTALLFGFASGFSFSVIFFR